MNPFLPSEIDLSFTLKKRNGALLYADLIGFTKMSEEFAERGILGTGELTQIIDRCFESQLSVVRKYGGDVVEFIGDALFIKFKKFGSAKKCAAEMAQRIKYFSDIETSAGRFSLSMRIILSKGSWNELILGTPEKLLFFLTGGILKKIAQHEKKTVKGEVVTVESAVKMDREKTRDVSSTLRKREKKAFLPEFSEKIPRKESYGEFRSVACVFLRIEGYDEENPDLESLNSTCIKIIESVHKHRGSINDTDNAVTEGSKLLILFGAPVAFGDECQRAVEFALDVTGNASSTKGVKISASAGAGYVFAGMIGDKKRRKYSVIGDVVNTTARILDGLSKGETAVTEDVYRMTKNKIDYVRMKSVSVKGKKDMLKRYKPRGFKFDSASRRLFVGREKELRIVKDKIIKGRSVVLVTGQPGIGKTRLLEEVSKFAGQKGILVLKTKADENRPAFDLFSSLVEEICSIKDGDSSERKLSKIKRVLREKKTLRKISKAGVIADMLLGVEYHDERFSKLDPELKKRNLIESLLVLLKSAGKRFCLIADNLQWAGPEDIEVIEFLLKSLMLYSKDKDCFILSSRKSVFNSSFGRGIDTTEITLEPLGQDDFEIFVRKILGKKMLEKNVFQDLVSKSEKNPFYAEQMLSYMIDKKLIFETPKEWKADSAYRQKDLPESIFSIVTARIDGLSEKIRESLKAASAIGMEFSAGFLDEVMKEKTEQKLSAAVQTGLLSQNDRKELEYNFSHALFKDVIYQSIIAQKRREIHSAIAWAIEKHSDIKSRETLSSLARHYDAAENWRKAYKYRLEAGLKSAGEYLNEEAAQNLERAHFISSEHLGSKAKEAVVLEELAELYLRTGKFKESLEKTSLLESLEIDKPVMKSKISRFKARLAEGEGEFRKSLIALEDSFAHLTGNSREILREKIFNLLARSTALRDLFMYKEALDEVLKTEEIYVKSKKLFDDKKIQVILYREKAMALTVILDLENAMKMYEKSIESAELTGDKFTMESSLSNIGYIYNFKSEPTKAMEYYRKAQDIAREIGDSRGICLSFLNIGCAHNDMNETDKALEKFSEALKISLEMDFVKITMFLYINIGNTYNNKRLFRKALQNTEKALIYAEELGDKSAMARIYENLGNIFNKKCDIENAVKYYTETLKYLNMSKDPIRMVSVLENLADLNLEKMQYKEALKLLKKNVRICRKHDLSDRLLDTYVSIRDILHETGKIARSRIYDEYADLTRDKCKDEESLASYFMKKADYIVNEYVFENKVLDPVKLQEAEEHLERVSEIIGGSELETVKTEYLFFLGRVRRLSQDFESSLFHLSEARKRTAKIRDIKKLAKIYLELALLFKVKDSLKASQYLDKSVREYVNMKNEKRAEFSRKRFFENNLVQ